MPGRLKTPALRGGTISISIFIVRAIGLTSCFVNRYFFASIMDGHGGEASSAWLRENLFKSLSDKCEGKRASGTIGTAVQDGTPGGGYLADALKAGYESADER